MKNMVKLFGVIALVAVIGFSMTACDTGGGGTSKPAGGSTGGGGSGKTTYKYSDDEGNSYKLLITPSEARSVQAGDTYTLTITFQKDGKVQKSTGTVENFENNQLTLKSSEDKKFNVMVRDNNIAGFAGSDLPFELPKAKSVTISGFTNWKGTHSNGDYYPMIGVFLIADLDKLYKEGFPIVSALQYPAVQPNGNAGNVTFDLIIPVDNTWNYGRMPWTGSGYFYVVIAPSMPQYKSFYSDEAKVYMDNGNPVKVSINDQTTTLEFSKFADYPL